MSTRPGRHRTATRPFRRLTSLAVAALATAGAVLTLSPAGASTGGAVTNAATGTFAASPVTVKVGCAPLGPRLAPVVAVTFGPWYRDYQGSATFGTTQTTGPVPGAGSSVLTWRPIARTTPYDAALSIQWTGQAPDDTTVTGTFALPVTVTPC